MLKCTKDPSQVDKGSSLDIVFVYLVSYLMSHCSSFVYPPLLLDVLLGRVASFVYFSNSVTYQNSSVCLSFVFCQSERQHIWLT